MFNNCVCMHNYLIRREGERKRERERQREKSMCVFSCVCMFLHLTRSVNVHVVTFNKERKKE